MFSTCDDYDFDLSQWSWIMLERQFKLSSVKLKDEKTVVFAEDSETLLYKQIVCDIEDMWHTLNDIKVIDLYTIGVYLFEIRQNMAKQKRNIRAYCSAIQKYNNRLVHATQIDHLSELIYDIDIYMRFIEQGFIKLSSLYDQRNPDD